MISWQKQSQKPPIWIYYRLRHPLVQAGSQMLLFMVAVRRMNMKRAVAIAIMFQLLEENSGREIKNLLIF